MFKNPLKYQQGGAAPSQEEQQILAAFIQWLPKRVKEFQGMQPEQIAQTLDGMSKTPEGKKQLQQLMSQFQQEMQGGSQAFRQGGKIHDFICKHAKGGKAGCGCKQEGGEIENKKPGYSVREQRYPNGQVAGRDEYANGMIRSSLNPGTTDEWYWMGEEGTPFAIEPESQRSRGPIFGTKYVNQNYWNWINNQMDMARKYGTLDYKENGGKVLKGQRGLSSGKFDIPFGAYMKAYFNKRSTPNVGAATKRSFGYSTSDGNEYYLEDANVGRNSVDTWVNVTPQKDTIIMQKLPSNHINDLEDYQMEAIMQRMRPDIKRVNNHENGGKVEKAQSGKKVNNKRRTITEVDGGLSKYDAEEMGIDPNTIVPTGSIITAYPNTKPYIVNGQVPFNKRNGLVFNLGGIEAREVEDGSVLGGGIPGRKYKVSSITPQENYYPTSSNYDAMNYPFIMRYASPKDTIYNLGFETYNKNSPAYPGIRLMYNSAIDLPNTMAGDEKSHRELQRQRQERASKKEAQGGEIKKKESTKIRKGQAGFLNLWQSAYNSKFGKGLRNLMFGTDSDLSNEEYVKKHGYSKPIMGMPPAVKISYIPEGVYGSTRMAEQAAKAAKEVAKFKHISPLDGGRLGHTIKDVSGVHLKNNGGKVEKAQDGEKTNDTPYNGTISQGKPRSKVSQAIDNNSKARNFVKGAKQFVKSPMVKWPLAGALAYGGYRLGLTPTVQSMGDELAPHMAPYLFPFLSQLRPKFILDTMNPMKEPPKVEKPGDVFWAVPSNEKGGKVEKAQGGTRSLYQQITADGPETYVDGYGTVREMSESPIITGLRKAYHWINMDRTLSNNAYSQKHGYSKPLTGMPPAVYISPVAQEIELAKIIGNRIPTQGSKRITYSGKINPKDKIWDYDIDKIYNPLKIKTNNTAAGVQMEAEHPVMLDYDIDKIFTNTINPVEYNIKPIRLEDIVNVPRFIINMGLRAAPGIIGSAAAGSYVATRKDKKEKEKKENSENK